jgi:hypothetical protein
MSEATDTRTNPGVAIAGIGLVIAVLSCVVAYTLGSEGLMPVCVGAGGIMLLIGILLILLGSRPLQET